MPSCKFIKAGSANISGIKTYSDFVKLKFAGKDLSLASDTKYVDSITGDVFFYFNIIRSHKSSTPSKPMITTYVEGFRETWKSLGVIEDDSLSTIDDSVAGSAIHGDILHTEDNLVEVAGTNTSFDAYNTVKRNLRIISSN